MNGVQNYTKVFRFFKSYNSYTSFFFYHVALAAAWSYDYPTHALHHGSWQRAKNVKTEEEDMDDNTPKANMIRVETLDGFCRYCMKLTVHTKQGNIYQCQICGKTSKIEGSEK